LKDLDFIREQLNGVLKEASKYADQDNETKKEFVIRVKEKAKKLFELENTPLTGLSSYIWNKFDDIQFTINERYFYTLFNETEKGKYSSNCATTVFIEKDGILTNPVTGQIKINDITFSPDSPSDVKPKLLGKSDETIDEPFENKYTDLLNLISDTANKLSVTCDAIKQKFEDNTELVIEGFQPFSKNQKLFANYYAQISNSKDVMDDRNKWGDYEKIMVYFLTRIIFLPYP